jgi:hypothetical protein
MADLPKEVRSEASANLHPKWGLAREDLDRFLQSTCRFRTGSRFNAVMVVGLPQGLYIQQPLPMPVENASEELTYEQMPQTFRDDVWRLFEKDRGRRESGNGL